MNGLRMLILKDSLDKICEELYKELPLTYAELAIKIVKKYISKAISKTEYINFE